jgi:hypothetical protein
MLIQDALTGRLHEIPDHHYGSYLGEYGQLYEPQWGEYPQGYGYSPQYGASQVVYDRLGNPVGLFPLLTALAPLAAKALPVAAKVLPGLAKRFLPGLAKRFLPGLAKRFLPLLRQAAPGVMEPIREAINAEPANVAGYGGYGQVIYDGLGNPVGIGWNPFNVVRNVVNTVRGAARNIPIVGRMVSNLIPRTPAFTSSPYLYPQTQPYPTPQVPPNWPSADMVNSMSPEGYPYPTTPSAPWPHGWRRRPYWRGYGRYRNWSRGWGQSYGYGRRPWRQW